VREENTPPKELPSATTRSTANPALLLLLLGLSAVSAIDVTPLYSYPQGENQWNIEGTWEDSRFGGLAYICDTALLYSDPFGKVNFTGTFSERGFFKGWQLYLVDNRQFFIGQYYLAGTEPEQGSFIFHRKFEEVLSGSWWKGSYTYDQMVAKVNRGTWKIDGGNPWELKRIISYDNPLAFSASGGSCLQNVANFTYDPTKFSIDRSTWVGLGNSDTVTITVGRGHIYSGSFAKNPWTFSGVSYDQGQTLVGSYQDTSGNSAGFAVLRVVADGNSLGGVFSSLTNPSLWFQAADSTAN